MSRFYEWSQGRKNGNGLIAAALLTIMAIPLGATFAVYMTGILTALAITNGSVAAEDIAKARAK